MTLASLPVQKVYIAFNPNSGVYSLQSAMTAPLSNAYWTEVTAYNLSFSTTSGKQHYLDRMEASTLKMTLNGRDGYFLNGTTNGTGYVLSPRTPVAVTATWLGVTYPVFFGYIDSIDEKTTDQVNFELDINCADYTKFLSETYMHSPAFWSSNAATGSEIVSWYRCNNTTAVTVTSAHSTGTTIVYQSANQFTVGEHVTVTGLGGLATLNQSNATITAATSSSFTITVSIAVTDSTGTGVAYNTYCVDYRGVFNGQYVGPVSYPVNGAIIYDTDGCVDLANGTSKGSGHLALNTYSTTMGGIDLWVLGQSIGGTTITVVTDGSGATTLTLRVTAAGLLQVFDGTTPYTSTVVVNDGYWHHVGLVSDSSGILHLYADSTFTAMGSYTGWKATSGLVIGGSLNAQVDEVFISDASNNAQLVQHVQFRYRAGSMLQTGFPVTSNKISSGQRIAEILLIAGFGSFTGGDFTGGTLTTPAYMNLTAGLYYIANAYQTPQPFVDGAANQGYASVEPYYWDSPVTNMTALDLILQIVDTDIGLFYQTPGANFYFFDQNYYGTWTFTNGTPPTTSWTTTYTNPTAAEAWTDDNTGAAIYWPNLQITRDDVDVYTSVKITPQAGVDQIYENVIQEPRYGKSTLIKASTVNSSLSDALSTAYFLGHLFQKPLTRVQSVELHSETPGNLAIMLRTNIGDVVKLKRTQPGAQTTADPAGNTGYVYQNFAVESINHTFQADPGQWITTFTLDPYPVRS